MKPTVELANIQFNPAKAYPEDLKSFVTRHAISVIHEAASKFKQLNLSDEDYLIQVNSRTEKWDITITATAFDASDFETRTGTILTYSEAQNY